MAVMIGAVVVSMAIAPEAAFADKRVALVVGNSNYQTVPQLPNPSRDASAIAKLFRDAGFDTVDIQLDVGNLEFKRAIRRFEATADQADIVLTDIRAMGDILHLTVTENPDAANVTASTLFAASPVRGCGIVRRAMRRLRNDEAIACSRKGCSGLASFASAETRSRPREPRITDSSQDSSR